MKKENIKCDECNSHVSYDANIGNYRCDTCGAITDKEGFIIYDVQTMQ